jgi:hypothetical protein
VVDVTVTTGGGTSQPWIGGRFPLSPCTTTAPRLSPAKRPSFRRHGRCSTAGFGIHRGEAGQRCSYICAHHRPDPR